jgi:sigma-E factor negative regulatory protein RseA
MKNTLSALLDGEAEEHEVSSLLASMHADADLRQESSVYCLIGDSLRGETSLDRDLVAGVMQVLADGPVVLAPRARPRSAMRPLLALAASAAGVAVVGWLALVPRLPEPTPPILAKNELVAPRTDKAGKSAVVAPIAQGNMPEYLLAHQASISGLQLPSPAGHIRPVSVAGRE